MQPKTVHAKVDASKQNVGGSRKTSWCQCWCKQNLTPTLMHEKSWFPSWCVKTWCQNWCSQKPFMPKLMPQNKKQVHQKTSWRQRWCAMHKRVGAKVGASKQVDAKINAKKWVDRKLMQHNALMQSCWIKAIGNQKKVGFEAKGPPLPGLILDILAFLRTPSVKCFSSPKLPTRSVLKSNVSVHWRPL